MVDLTAFAARKEDILLSSRRRAARVSGVHPRLQEVLTYSTTVGSAGDGIVFELEIHVKDVGIQLDLAVEAIADAYPVRCWFRHVLFSPARSSRKVHCVGVSGVTIAWRW